MSKMTVTTDEIAEFLESYIHSGNAPDSIENLYIEYQRYGKRVFKREENRPLIHKIVKAIKREYGIEG